MRDDDMNIIFSEILRKWSLKNNYSPNEIFKFFSSLGYQAFTCDSNKLVPFNKMTDETIFTNFFFLHEIKHKKHIINLVSN